MSDQEQDEGGASVPTASKRPMMWLRAVCQEQDEGGASAPTPLNPTPAPTDTPRLSLL